MAYTKAGLSPDGGSSYLLPRLIGLRRTQELMITNRVLTAAEALEWGLVTDRRARRRTARQARRAGRPNRLWRKEVQLGGQAAAADDLRGELRGAAGPRGSAISECADSADGKEGIAAFLGKRRPDFA